MAASLAFGRSLLPFPYAIAVVCLPWRGGGVGERDESIRAEIILSVYGQAGEVGGVQYRLGMLDMVGRPLGSAVATVARVLGALARNDPPRRSACF